MIAKPEPCPRCGYPAAAGRTCYRLVCGLAREVTVDFQVDGPPMQVELDVPAGVNRLKVQGEFLKAAARHD